MMATVEVGLEMTKDPAVFLQVRHSCGSYERITLRPDQWVWPRFTRKSNETNQEPESLARLKLGQQSYAVLLEWLSGNSKAKHLQKSFEQKISRGEYGHTGHGDSLVSDGIVGETSRQERYFISYQGEYFSILTEEDEADLEHYKVSESESSQIQDSIHFCPGILPADVQIVRVIDDLILDLVTVGEQITIKDWYASKACQMKQAVFGDGTIWTREYLNNEGLDFTSIKASISSNLIGKELESKQTVKGVLENSAA